jgi:hypothetical protein
LPDLEEAFAEAGVGSNISVYHGCHAEDESDSGSHSYGFGECSEAFFVVSIVYGAELSIDLVSLIFVF